MLSQKFRIEKYFVLLSCLIFFVFPSAVINPIGLYMMIVISCFLSVMFFLKFSIHKDVVIALVFVVFYLLLLSFLAQNIMPITYAIALPIALLFNILIFKSPYAGYIYHGVVRYSTAFAFLGLFCSFCGFVYAYFGGSAHLCIENPDGRSNCLYFLSFSNAVIGNVIRPSFIFDEPGAFSFYLVSIVIMRELNKFSSKISALILFIGLITFSVTHLIIFVIFILFKTINNLRRFISLLTMFFLLSTASIDFNKLDEFSFFTGRINSEQMVENNRTVQLSNFFNILDGKVFLLGNIDCLNQPENVCIEHGDITSSPVTPTYRLGVLGLIVQVLTHGMIIFFALANSRLYFCALSLTILLLQRPFFTTANYAFLIYFLIFMMFFYSINKFVYGIPKYTQ